MGGTIDAGHFAESGELAEILISNCATFAPITVVSAQMSLGRSELSLGSVIKTPVLSIDSNALTNAFRYVDPGRVAACLRFPK